MRHGVNRFQHQSWFKISTIVARSVALMAAVVAVPLPVCGKATTFDRNNVACEYAFDWQSTSLLRYYVHGATYVDERAMVHEVATGRDYGFALNDMYSVIGLVDDLGNLLEGYHYDVYGTRYSETVTAFEDLYVAIRTRLGQSASGQDEYDLNGDLTIDLLDLLLARTAPTVAPIPSTQPYAFHGRRRNVHTPTVGTALVLYDYRARTYDPILGRFHQRDPAEYIDSFNLYLAMGGNPLRFMDPTGQFFLDILSAATIANELNALELDAYSSILSSVRGFVAMVNFRNALLGELADSAAVDPQGIDSLIGTMRTVQIVVLGAAATHLLTSGLKFAKSNIGRIGDILGEGQGRILKEMFFGKPGRDLPKAVKDKLIDFYRGIIRSVTGARDVHRKARRLNAARIRFLQGKGPPPGVLVQRELESKVTCLTHFSPRFRLAFS
jgi:RHS repeat-associated protein